MGDFGFFDILRRVVLSELRLDVEEWWDWVGELWDMECCFLDCD